MLETHPLLSAQAHGWDPAGKTAGSSSKSMEWKCERGHIWSARIPSRAGKQSSGCPFCSNQRVLPGFNDIATTNPEILDEIDDWDPAEYLPGTKVKLPWKCGLGHKWEATPADRISKKSKCPICSNTKLLSGFNDLATEFPGLALEADGWDPTQIISRTGKKLNWKCKYGHTWTISPNARIKKTKQAGCPYCSNHFAWPGFNDLLTTNPELASEAHGWDPSKFIAGSAKKVEWKCHKGHIYVMSLSNRSSGHACAVCANRQTQLGVNDLHSQFPEIAAEAYGWDPQEVRFSDRVKRDWRCPKDHVYEASPKSRTTAGKTGCPYCANKKVLPGFNDLQTVFPLIAQEADGWNPTEYIAGSHIRKQWKCKLGHTWSAQIGSRTGSGSGCPTCANKIILSGFNDLTTTHPEIASQAHGWNPKLVGAGSHKRMNWICEHGHEWSAIVIVRTSSNSGCPKCFGSGYDSNLDGSFYLIEQKELGYLQIGISNYPDKRLKAHSKRGWEVLEIRGPMDGLLARQIETSVLRMLRKNGAQMLKGSNHEPFDGYSESWLRASFPITAIGELLDLAE